MDSSRRLIPAIGSERVTRFHDSLVRPSLRDQTLELVEQVALAPGNRILGLGCGTATFTPMLKRVVLTAVGWWLQAIAAVAAQSVPDVAVIINSSRHLRSG